MSTPFGTLARSLVNGFAGRFRRQRKWIQAVVLAVSVIPLIALAWFSAHTIGRNLTELAVSRRVAIAHLCASTLKLHFDDLSHFGASLAYRVRFQEFLKQKKWHEAVDALAGVPETIPEVERILLVDPHGILLADWPALRPAGSDFSGRDWYRGVVKDWQPYFSNAYKRVVEPRYNVASLSVPVRDGAGTVQAILVLQMRISSIASWAHEADLGQRGFVSVIDRLGNVAEETKGSGTEPLDNVLDNPVVGKVLAGQKGWEIAFDPRSGERELLAYEPAGDSGWGIIARQPVEEAFAARDAALRTLFLIYGLLLAAGIGLACLVILGLWTLWEAGEKFRITVETTREWIWTVDREGRSLYDNPALQEILGYAPAEMLGRRVEEFIVPEDLPRMHQIAAAALEGKAGWKNVVLRWRHKDGGVRHVESSAVPTFDLRGELTGFQGANRDVTERVGAEDELRQARDAALQLAKTKAAFLANMSHEIRTPMNGVIGMAALLSETTLTPAQREQVDTILTSGEALLTVINDILDFSRIESERMPLERRPFNLRQCVEEALDLLAPRIREKKLEAAYLLSAGVPAVVVGDAVRLRQILVNLLGNAVKFTVRGEIVLSVEVESLDAEACLLHFSVSDTGIGIPAAAIPTLFQSFQQVDDSTTRRFGGTGLGLAISRRLAELMGGSMWVESAEGKGSAFHFTALLPVTGAAGKVARAGDMPSATALDVLVVDDNATNRRILELQLAAWKMKAVGVASGPEALERLAGARFDAVLIDFQMPGMDGVALAREIGRRTTVPLLLLSSAGIVPDGEGGSLFHAQLAKPVKQSQLFSALMEAAGERVRLDGGQSGGGGFDRGLAERHPLRLLVVEDNPVNQKVILMSLAGMGYRADLAMNGMEAIAAVASRTVYDAILMDIQMPGMDGTAAAREILKKTGTGVWGKGRPYLVALTANALEGDREKYLAQGFDAYLGKPIQVGPLQELLAAIPRRSA